MKIDCLKGVGLGLLMMALSGWCSAAVVVDAHKGEVFSLVFSPDGKHLVSGGEDGLIKSWDAKTHRLAASWQDHAPGYERPGRRLAISPDGSALAAASGEGLHIWDFKSGSLLRQWTESKVDEVLYLADGRLVFSTKEKLHVWDGSGKETKTIPCPPKRPFGALSASVDGRIFAAVNPNSDEAVFWNTQDWSRMKTVPASGGSVVFSPQGVRLLTRKGLRVQLLDLAGGKPKPAFEEYNKYGHQVDCTAWALSPSGEVLALAVSDGRIALWSPGSDPRWLHCERRIRPGRVFLNRVVDGTPLKYLLKNMVVGGLIENSSFPLELPFLISAVAFSPDGRGVAAGTGDGEVVFYGGREVGGR